jgi:hypothetical protein
VICSSIVGISLEGFRRSSEIAVRDASEPTTAVARHHFKARLTWLFFSKTAFTILQSYQATEAIGNTDYSVSV